MEEEGSMTNGESEQSGNSGDTDIEPVCESDKTVTPKSGKSSKKKSKSKKGKSKIDKSDTCKSAEETTKKKSKAEKELSRVKIIDRLEKFGLTGLIICGELVDAASIEANSCCQETTPGGICEDVQTETPSCSVSADCDNILSLVNDAEVVNCANKDSVIMGDAESKESKKAGTEKVDDVEGAKCFVDTNVDCVKNVGDKCREMVLETEEERKKQDKNDESVKTSDTCNYHGEMVKTTKDHGEKGNMDNKLDEKVSTEQLDERVTTDDNNAVKVITERKDKHDEKVNTDDTLDKKIITDVKNNGKLNADYASDVVENYNVNSSPCGSSTDELRMSVDEAKEIAEVNNVDISELNIKSDQSGTDAASEENTDECVELNDCEHVLENTKVEEIESDSNILQTCDVKNNDTEVVQDSVEDTAVGCTDSHPEVIGAVTEMIDIDRMVVAKAEELSVVQINANDNETDDVPEIDATMTQAVQDDSPEIADERMVVLQIIEENEGDKGNEHVDKDENENVGKAGVVLEENISTDKVFQCHICDDDKNQQLQEITAHQNINKLETTAKNAHASDVNYEKNDVGVQTDEIMTELETVKFESKVDTTVEVDDNPCDSVVEAVDLTGTEQEWDQVMGLLETSQAELEEVTARGETRHDSTAQLEEEEKVDTEKQRLEEEVESLKSELASARSELHKSQSLVRSQQGEHNRTVMTLKRQLYRQQVSLRKQRDKSEQQMGDVMSHLLLLEGRLKKEQQCLRREMQNKDQLINVQANEVLKLRNQNEQLLNAIQEICAKGGMNGYLREKKKKSGSMNEGSENGGKYMYDKKDKKGGNSNGKLGSVKDKFLWKNRSSLELNSFNLEKYLIKSERLCTSQEDLQNIGKEKNQGVPNGNTSAMDNGVRPEPRARCHSESVANRSSLNSHSPRSSISSPRHSQNYFSENEFDTSDMNKSTSESSQLSENSSGVYSLSDQDIQSNESYSGHYGNDSYYDEDEGHFSFSSTHINMAIAEEDVVSHTGSMTSMGSMPILSNARDHQTSPSDRGRPHSLTSVDFHSLEQHAQNLQLNADCTTPPHSPSYTQAKNELTPFQTFKTMFKRKGSKNKGSKKRAASLSTTTNIEYSEALKKHFQKYDMS